MNSGLKCYRSSVAATEWVGIISRTWRFFLQEECHLLASQYTQALEGRQESSW